MSVTNVSSVDYKEETSTLLVHYAGGTTSSYSPVLYEEFQECLKAESLSKFVHGIIRKGNLVGKKVEA
jgi:hypothetical protein